jgi:hypothetical protein
MRDALTEVLGISTMRNAAGGLVLAKRIWFIRLSAEPITLSMMFVFYGMLTHDDQPGSFRKCLADCSAARRPTDLSTVDRKPTVVNTRIRACRGTLDSCLKRRLSLHARQPVEFAYDSRQETVRRRPERRGRARWRI